ncbi:MAG: hypothetical protein QNJ61_17895 [Desulfobacterales bacterium]|nr:hypothetical protein [Desulfobacterales bacterium]
MKRERRCLNIYYVSDLGDSNELPEDIDEEKYIAIPHKNELDLGKALVFEFTTANLPGEIEKVDSIFRRKGAYSRFKDLLEKIRFVGRVVSI